jgi:protein O-mannosyl-transferase
MRPGNTAAGRVFALPAVLGYNGPGMKDRSVIWEIVSAAGLLVFAAACAWPSLSADWEFDDPQHILNNPAVHLTRLSWSALRGAIAGPLSNRPLSYLSFALDYYRGGADPHPYHVTNLVLHLLCALLVWRLLRRLLRHPQLPRPPGPRLAALLGALVFAVHPLQTGSVTYIVQRMNLLASLFTLAAILCWLGAAEAGGHPRRRYGWLAGFAAATVLGLLSKENAFSIFPLVAVLAWCLRTEGAGTWLRGRAGWIVALAGMASAAALWYGPAGALSGYTIRNFTMGERLLTQPRVILDYVGLIIFPAHHLLTVNHDVAVSHSLVSPLTTLPAIIVVLGLTALAAVHCRRAPLLALGWLWFMGGLALESSVLPLEMEFEHRTYLPLIGLVMIAADLARRVRLDRRAVPALALIAVFLGVGTWERDLVWKDAVSLWRDAVLKAPELPRAWGNLCAGGFARGEFTRSEAWCRRAVGLDPHYGAAWYNLGLCLARQDRPAEAETALARSAELDPDWAETYYHLGRVRIQLGRGAEAVTPLERATQLVPADPLYWYELGIARVLAGDIAAGCGAFRRARSLPASDLPDLRASVREAMETAGCTEN